MFGMKKVTPLDELIASCENQLSMVPEESDEYSRLMTSLERLYKLKAQERPQRVSRDTLTVVAGNLIGILVIIAYEQKHVLSTRGLNFLIKPSNTSMK